MLHGYATSRTNGGKTIVHTSEKGAAELNLAEWDITPDHLGRSNKVIILTLDVPIMLHIETEALERAMAESADEGPLFILLEIDTPGGDIALAQQICGAISKAVNCQVIAFVKGGEYGGAISAGAAVAFACDKIYIADNAAIGAAALVAISRGAPVDFRKAYGEEVGEKFSSAWQAYLASLAEQNKRPALLARAMVDKDIEVIEVSQAEKRLFVEPVNKNSEQKLVRIWSKAGSLLTLTAAEAVKCGIADRVVGSRQELLRDLEAQGARIVINDCIQKAGKELKRAKLKVGRLNKSLDLKSKQILQTRYRANALRILREARKDYKVLVTLAKRYPDLHMAPQLLEGRLNSVEAAYQKAKMRK